MRLLFILALLQLAAPALAEQGNSLGGGRLPTGDDLAQSGPQPIAATPPRDDDSVPLEATVSGTAQSVRAFPLPLHARISSGFGLREDPINGSLRTHSGVDLPSAAGTPVEAMAAGRVIYSGWMGGYGNLVEIDHGGGLVTRYGHLSRIIVSHGQLVGAHATLGLVGSTGRSTGNHLHFEVRIDGRAVNPHGFASQRDLSPSSKADLSAWLPPFTTVAPRWIGWSDPGKTGQLPFPIIR